MLHCTVLGEGQNGNGHGHGNGNGNGDGDGDGDGDGTAWLVKTALAPQALPQAPCTLQLGVLPGRLHGFDAQGLTA